MPFEEAGGHCVIGAQQPLDGHPQRGVVAAALSIERIWSPGEDPTMEKVWSTAMIVAFASLALLTGTSIYSRGIGDR